MKRAKTIIILTERKWDCLGTKEKFGSRAKKGVKINQYIINK